MSMNRRQLLKNTALVGGGLLLGFELSGCKENKLAPSVESSFQPSSFLQITADGKIILQLNRQEMGQGVYTGLTTLVAEELEVEPNAISVQMAPVHPDFIDPDAHVQMTGGSSSLKNSFEPLRKVGATAKAMLLAAAAQKWNTPVELLRAANSSVFDDKNNRSAHYGELVAIARTLSVPKNAPLKTPAQFQWIGKFDRRLDAQQKVDGSSVFGIDVHVDNMQYAVLVRCPHFGGTLNTFDASESKKVSGVQSIFALGGKIAIVANGYWPAHKAAQLLKVDWHKGALAGVDSKAIFANLNEQLEQTAGRKTAEEGSAPSGETQLLEADYFAPYQAHAPMEPLNCVAAVRADRIDVWVGNQSPDLFRNAVADVLQRPRESVFVHTPMLGGGFGRRVYVDYALEAALISQHINAPVKLIWSREDDLRHDYYRPASLSRLRAQLQNGKLVSWQHKIVCPSIMKEMMPNFIAATLPPSMPKAPLKMLGNFIGNRDFTSTEGADKLPYALPYFRLDHVNYDPGIPVGTWRSVGHSINAFFVESFFDEVAHALQQDPLALRLQLLKPEQEVARQVLQLVAEKSAWGQAPAGHFHGIALHESFGTTVAEVAEISIDGEQIRVHKVVCAAHCGQVVNPDIVAMQMESGIIFALSAALKGEITIEDGAVKQNNFHDFELVRMSDAPTIEVHIVPSTEKPTGVGEPGVPPLAPALGNAIFAATGKRLRSLPFRLG